MALSAAVVLEVRNGGSDTNGGGFKTGASGTDWSLQNPAQYTQTDGAANGTTAFSSAGSTFGTDVIGNLIYIVGGSAPLTGAWYEITARPSTTSLTLDRSPATSTGCTFRIGGALASPGIAASIATVAGMKVFIKYNATPFSATSASTNIAGGCVSGTALTAYCGYDTTRSLYNTDANRPTFQANVASAILMGNLNSDYVISSMILDGNSQTTCRGTQQSGFLFYCKAMNCTTAGFSRNQPASAILCEATACTALPFAIDYCFACVAHDNTLASPSGVGSFATPLVSAIGCLSYGNNCDGYANGILLVNSVAYNNALFGFNAANLSVRYINCIAENNTSGGFRINTGTVSLLSCASYNNTGGRSVNSGGGVIWGDLNSITGSGSFFTNAAGTDFTLNNTAGQGALCRSVGFPTAFPVPAMNNYADVGALRHQDPAGGGGGVVGVIGV